MLQKNDENILGDQWQRYQSEIEIPVCLNLGLSYLKLKDYPLAIKYCTQVLDKDADNDKALYRRGLSYLGKGDI
jgi:FK506-binding protein 4/5